MREEIIDTLNRLYGKDIQTHGDVADYLIQVFKAHAMSRVQDIVGDTDYSVYDHPYFNTKANTIRDDVLELSSAVLGAL